MAYSYDEVAVYDFDAGAVSFRVSNGSSIERWLVSDEALRDHFGAPGIGEASVSSFQANAYQIVEVGNTLRQSRGANLLLTSADF